jgi:8-oxo-dGTP pyrophosphatase MutT (NUDIX family)
VDSTVAGTVAKESWEEAGIPADLAATARAGGTVGIFREQPDGIQHETIFVHDLRLPIDFAPANQDGEAVEHRRVSLPEAARLIAIESGPEAVTADAALVALDCLLRYGAVPADSPYHAPLAALRRHSG